MYDWQLIVPLMLLWLDQWAALSSRVPESIVVAAILLPIALAIFSKRIGVVSVCTLLAVIAFCTFVAPSKMPVTLATGIYLISLIIALSGILARRKARALQAEFASLRQDVNHLLEVEKRRILNKLHH